VALAALVGDWQGGLGATVGDGDDVSGLIYTALKLTLIAALDVMGVRRVQGRYLRAVGAVNGIEEVVQEAGVGVVLLVDQVVGLEQN